MSSLTYSSLHTHSHFSLDGVGSIPQWIKAAKEKGLYGLSITDHGDCSSLLELYTVGKKEKFPIVMGCEFYIVEKLDENEPTKKYYHITILSNSFEGYKNLCRLSSVSFRSDHFYYRPRITFSELFDHKDGLTVLSGCLAGPLSKNIIEKTGLEEILLKEFYGQFKDNYYLELQPSIVIEDNENINKQEIVNQRLIELSKIYNIPLVITPDAHITDSRMKVLQDIKLHARSKGNWDFDQSHHLFTPKQLVEKIAIHHEYLLDYLEESMINSNLIVDKCQFDIPKFESLLPNIDITQHELYELGDDQESLFIKVIQNNNRIDLNNTVYFERLKYEYNTLFKNGVINFLPYFLLLEDVVRWCGKNGITVGPGRGSASGSLLVYGLKITHLDPIKYNLSFDRFINKGRIINGTFPDIDMDFSDPHAVKKYVIEKFGQEYVAIMGTIQTLKAKGALKDVLAVLKPEMSFEEKNNLTSFIPQSQQGEDELEFFQNHLLENKKLADFLNKNKDVYDAVIDLLGQCRQKGSHPCGLIVSSKPLSDTIPLWNSHGDWVTQYTADWCKKAGVVKYDFLGLNTLRDIAECLRLIKLNHNIDIDPYLIDWNDKKTLDAFSKADTDTIFQFSTFVGKNILAQMEAVDSLEDLAAITALGRPGPMDVGMDKHFILRKNGKEQIKYPHDSLIETLKDTYGIIVYQEQVMLSVQILGGFSLEESDEVRRAMGSKNKDLLQSYKVRFVDYAVQSFSDINIDRASEIWDQIESFARYGFNKSHSVAYAMIGFICQYLRQHYSLEWYSAVFSNGSANDQKELYPKIKELMVLPDINLSKDSFYIKDSKIVMSLSFIHGLGERSVEDILKNQPYNSFSDFIQRVNKRVVKKDVVLNLIFSEAFKSIEGDKSTNQLIEEYFLLIKAKKGIPEEYRNLNQFQILKYRFEVLPIGDIDYSNLFEELIQKPVISIKEIKDSKQNGWTVSFVGKIEGISSKNTKNNNKMGTFSLSNKNDKIKVIIWPRQWQELENNIVENDIVQVWGEINIWNNQSSVILKKVSFINKKENVV